MTKYVHDRQRCKVKVRKFLFNISWRFGVMEENLRGADSASLPPFGMDRVKITTFSSVKMAAWNAWNYVKGTILWHRVILFRVDYILVDNVASTVLYRCILLPATRHVHKNKMTSYAETLKL